jgi:IS1 family transposase/transposase-like protein
LKTKIKRNIRCPNPKCKDHNIRFAGNIRIACTYKVYGGMVKRIEWQCDTCGQYFSETYGTFYYYRKKKPREIESVLEHLVRGNGVRDTAELVNISKDTVENIIEEAGQRCWDWYVENGFQIPAGHIEYDELWTFVMKKHSEDEIKGDVWIWVSFHRETRFLIYGVIGKHRIENGLELVKMTKGLIKQPSKHCSDELPCYENIFEQVYGQLIIPEKTGERGRPKLPYYRVDENLEYSQVHKTRSKGRIVNVEKRNVFGTMDEKSISTSLNERNNLNLRQDNGRLTRKSLKFSKELWLLITAFWIHFFHYNFRRPHSSLKQKNVDYDPLINRVKWIKKTPAMAAGICDSVLDWSLPLNYSSGFN